MRELLALLFIIFTINLVYSTEIDVNSKVETVTIYHSGALVSRTVLNELKPGINELVFNGLSSKIVLNSIKINNKEVTILNKYLIKKLTKEELNQLLDKKESLNKQLTLIEAKFSEVGFVSKVEDLEKMIRFYSDKSIVIKKELRELNKQIEEAKKLENTELKNENAAILKIIISLDEPLKKALTIQYVCGGIAWIPAYDISVENPANKTVEIKYLAKVMSQTGEDWDNITINLSSSFPLEAPTTLPKPKMPWLLEGRNYNNQNAIGSNEKDVDISQEIEELEGIEYDVFDLPSFLKLKVLKGLFSLKSNSTVFTFPISTFNLPANFYYYAYPSLDNATYLVAQVTEWDTLGFIDGIANVTYKSNSIGKSRINFTEYKDTLLLPLGKDNSVYLKRSEINDQKFFKATNSNKKNKMTLAYQYELKNNNSFPIHFELLDQFPISQTKNAEVILDKTSNGIINNELGEITWNLDLKSSETVKKELIFTIETEGNINNFMKKQVPVQKSKHPRWL